MFHKQSTWLKIAAITIAAPRYVGAFAVAVGADPFAAVPPLLHIEVASGAAMAVLEGLAVAYVFAQWRLTRQGTLQHRVLAAMLAAMLLTVPLIGLPYLLAAQAETYRLAGFMPFWVRTLWSLVVLAVPPLIIGAVGYADFDEAELVRHQAARQADIEQAQLLLEQTRQQSRQQKQLLRRQSRPEAEEGAVIRYRCPHCSRLFGSKRGLNGHLAHCKPAGTAGNPGSNGKVPLELEIAGE